MLTAAGATDLVADIPRENVQVSTEMLLARAPEVIVELHYGEELSPARLAAERAVWTRLPALPAVRTNRVYLLEGNDLVVPGPRVADAVERFARVIHPEAFAH
jgi:iron complex transport system substrate-binding protein